MKLWLSGVEPREKVQGVKAIRAVGGLHGTGIMQTVHFQSLTGALHVWDRVRRGEQVLLVVSDDAEVMKQATALLDDGGLRYQLTQDDDSPEPVEQDADFDAEQVQSDVDAVIESEEGEPEYVPTVLATQCAMVLLAQSDGVPAGALSTARSISRLTGHNFWEDVAEFILRTFPAPPEIQEQLLAQRQS